MAPSRSADPHVSTADGGQPTNAASVASHGAVFLDRDGVLNDVVFRDGRPASPRSFEEFVFVAGAADAVAALRADGWPVLVVTNQPDVARGALPRELLDAMTQRLRHECAVDDVAVCTHDDADGCACRKPRTGMLRELARTWNVDLAASFVVGDSWRDMAAGRAAGCTTILLRRSYNRDTETQADHVVTTLADAVRVIAGSPRDSGTQRSEGHARRYLDEARRILDRLDAQAIEDMVQALAALRARGGRLFFLGVGGGAGHAGHAVNDFRKLAAIECYAPTDNVSELTARTNDDGWDSTFVEYLRGSRLGQRDGVFVFSVGGGDAERGISGNIVAAVRLAKSVGATVFGVVGRDGGYTASVADHVVVVPVVNPEAVTPHTESFQALLWHLVVSHPVLRRVPMTWERVALEPAALPPESRHTTT